MVVPTGPTEDAREKAQQLLERAGLQRTSGGANTPPRSTQRRGAQRRSQRLRRLLSKARKRLEIRTVNLTSWSVRCFLLAVILFAPFDITSTFPVSVKWAMACVEMLVVSLVLLALAAIRHARGAS